jgi:hypothetical protein
MKNNYYLQWATIFVLWFMGSFLVHGILLGDEYAKLPQLFRNEDDSGQYFHLMLLAHVLLAGAFVWIYRQGIRDGSWMAQGLRYGVAIVALTVVPTYTIYFVVQPMPGAMVLKQILFDGSLVLVLALVTAFMNRSEA